VPCYSNVNKGSSRYVFLPAFRRYAHGRNSAGLFEVMLSCMELFGRYDSGQEDMRKALSASNTVSSLYEPRREGILGRHDQLVANLGTLRWTVTASQ
jgi:hypothetical protein